MIPEQLEAELLLLVGTHQGFGRTGAFSRVLTQALTQWKDKAMSEILTPDGVIPSAPQDFPDPATLTSAERIRRINDCRARVVNKEQVSEQELRYSVDLIRLERAQSTSKKSGGKTPPASAAIPSLSEL